MKVEDGKFAVPASLGHRNVQLQGLAMALSLVSTDSVSRQGLMMNYNISLG